MEPHGNQEPQNCPKKVKRTYCILCRIFYAKSQEQHHIHSQMHHKELDSILGSDTFHVCQACKTKTMTFNEYTHHIKTAQHMKNLSKMKNEKRLSLYKSLSAETIAIILKRNKQIKGNYRKQRKAHKAQLKKKSAELCEQMPMNGVGGNPSALKWPRNEQEQMWPQMQEACHTGSSGPGDIHWRHNAVINEPDHYYTESDFDQCGQWPENPECSTWYQSYIPDQCPQPVHLHRFDSGLPARNVPNESGQSKNLPVRPHTSHKAAADRPQARPPPTHHNRFFSQHSDFTRDPVPLRANRVVSSQPDKKRSEGLAQPAPSNKATCTTPPKDVDTMLKNIRRVLGVREPCRADREARKQNCENRAQGDVRATTSQRNLCTSAARDPAHPNQTLNKTTHIPKDVSEPSATNSQEVYITLSSPNTLISSVTSPEQNVNNSKKVRIAHKPKEIQGDKNARLKPTIHKLLSLSQSKSRLDMSVTQNQAQRKKTPHTRVTPRFGFEMVTHPMADQIPPQPEACDGPLSEGFHWESLPAVVSDLPVQENLPPPLQVTQDTNSCAEGPSDSLSQGRLDGPSVPEIPKVSVKEEPDTEKETEEFQGVSSSSKRKSNAEMADAINDIMSASKRKKTISGSPSLPDQGQMEQLLAVSLKEEELNRTLTGLDESLNRARIAVQAAFTEVQRLMLLKEQCLAEVDSLRAERIDILQTMQEGFSGALNVSKSPSTLKAGAPALTPTPSRPSSTTTPTTSAQPTPTTSTAPTSPRRPPTILNPMKQEEVCALPISVELVVKSDAPQPPVAPPSSDVPLTEQLKQETSGTLQDCGHPGTTAEQPLIEGSTNKKVQGSPSKPLDILIIPEKEDEPNEVDTKSNLLVKVIPSTAQEVITLDDSDSEGKLEIEELPVQPGPSQGAESVTPTSVRPQTSQQGDDSSKLKPPDETVMGDITAPVSLEDQKPSVGAFASHTGPVHGLQIHDGLLYTCSGDNTARMYCLVTRECKASFTGHTSKINCLLVTSCSNAPPRLFTGSSDQSVRCYSIKSQKCLDQISLPDRVLCLYSGWNILYVGLASGSVACYDLKTLKPLDIFECHGPRGVSCLRTAQEGARRLLLVGSYDSTISVRDARNGLLLRSLRGHSKTVLCMNVVNDLVFSGSSDASVHVHNIHSGELIRIYKGHSHAVTSIIVLGKVMLTSSLDKLVRVYELQSHDRLQVYGGHSDMVMCMAVHKSIIYTGCYDGSLKAMKLNLMKNYRCKWQNCTLIFGMPDHLLLHLTRDHTNPSLQMVKCRWRDCDAFFAKQILVQEKLPQHLKLHIDNDSSVEP